MTRFQLLRADCRDVMSNMGDNTVDSVICDPPYHLTSIVKRFGPGCAPQQFGTDGAFARAARGFMGQTWDGGDVAFDADLWREALRVLKPGGHVLAFGGTRTYHRLAVAIEDAGFEIRDCLFWLYGSGFPKSKNQGDGWGTQLKPACEPIVMARKPFDGLSIAANRAIWGTGAVNIDGCRVPVADKAYARNHSGDRGHAGTRGADEEGATNFRAGGGNANEGGRFPANVLHDGSAEIVALFPRQAGAKPPVTGNEPSMAVAEAAIYNPRARTAGAFHDDQGSAARFFYCAKASTRDRDEGCEYLSIVDAGVRNVSGRHLTRGYEDAPTRANFHPTVKPTDLMRWLCRLVTPAGGVVFDPFTGSGSTGKAALLEGMRFVGAELTPEYLPIAFARLEWAESQALAACA